MRQNLPRVGIALGLALFVVLVTVGPISVAPSTAKLSSSIVRAAVPDFPNCRLGVGASANSLTTYNYTPTRVGWYLDWNVYGSPPPSIEYYRSVKTKQDKSGSTYLPSYHITPTLDFAPGGLGPILQAYPGQVWIIGHEPDRPYSQDDVMPDMYAQIYHDAYQFIKSVDPTARVANGAIVEPTPLRLQYLDLVLQAYQTKYGMKMPVDVWNTHSYIIPENRFGPGADIPPGITATSGMQYTPLDHLDISVYDGQIQALRSWMKSRGYQDVPLISTEYGALYPLWYLQNFGLTQADIDNFIGNVINHMNTQRDLSIGYPADDYRLIQRVALYSLDDDSVFPSDPPDPTYFRWGSFLFRSSPPYTRTATGDGFVLTAQSLAPTVDWLVSQPRIVSGSLIVSPTQTVSPTVRVTLSNAGNTLASAYAVITFTDVTTDPNALIQITSIPPLNGCGAAQDTDVVWPDLAQGIHSLRIEVGSSDGDTDLNLTNNVLTMTVAVGTNGVYLPLINR